MNSHFPSLSRLNALTCFFEITLLSQHVGVSHPCIFCPGVGMHGMNSLLQLRNRFNRASRSAAPSHSFQYTGAGNAGKANVKRPSPQTPFLS